MKVRLSNKRIITLLTVDKTKPKWQETYNSMTSVLVLGKNSFTSGRIRYSLLFLTTTKLTGNEYYCYKIEGQRFFSFTWLNFEPSSDTYICFIVRNLDSRTTMLEDHESQWVYNSLITTAFLEFPQFTLYLPVNSRITQNPFYTLRHRYHHCHHRHHNHCYHHHRCHAYFHKVSHCLNNYINRCSLFQLFYIGSVLLTVSPWRICTLQGK